MMIKAQKYLLASLWLCFAVGAAVTCFILFKAGCAGDAKGGSLGDPVRALQLESYSLLPFILSAVFGGAAIGLMSKSIHRVVQGGTFATLILLCLWLTGMKFETWGVQSCF